ncbi:hypothetical protein BACPU_02500 [Bacillus pumilus]|nr:hypothetical protein BACPU_02500 [Bacillus pumilus]
MTFCIYVIKVNYGIIFKYIQLRLTFIQMRKDKKRGCLLEFKTAADD